MANQITNDDWPIYSVHVISVGQRASSVFHLFREILQISPAEAKALLNAPRTEVARGPRLLVEPVASKFTSAGAEVEIAVLPDVRQRLSKREDGPVTRMAEALCFPAFHAEALMRAISDPVGTRLRFTTFDSNMSMWISGAVHKGREPGRIEEVAAVSPENARRFWTSIDDLHPETIPAERTFGADGMSIEATYQNGDAITSFETWCPDPTSLPGRFIQLIYNLAWEVLKEQTNIDRLEHLYGYLFNSLPARLISGKVTCLRIFGSLASYHQNELQSLLNNLPKDAPLVIDMTNFDGMGTLIYPTFIAFAVARRLLAWVGSTNAKRHFKEMNLPASQVFDDTEAALKWIKLQTRAS